MLGIISEENFQQPAPPVTFKGVEDSATPSSVKKIADMQLGEKRLERKIAMTVTPTASTTQNSIRDIIAAGLPAPLSRSVFAGNAEQWIILVLDAGKQHIAWENSKLVEFLKRHMRRDEANPSSK